VVTVTRVRLLLELLGRRRRWWLLWLLRLLRLLALGFPQRIKLVDGRIQRGGGCIQPDQIDIQPFVLSKATGN